MKTKKLLSVLILSATFVLNGCNYSFSTNSNRGKLHNETKTITLQNAKTVHAKIDYGVGNINISGNEKKLMKGTFSYNHEDWKPKINYKVTNNKGELNVSQSTNSNFNNNSNKDVNDWSLNFNNNIPLDLDFNLGVADSKINLSKLTLQNVKINAGVGKVDLDFSGTYKNNVFVKLKGGVGKTLVYLPKNIGVKVVVNKGIGSVDVNNLQKDGDTYKNSSFSKSDVKLVINIEAGVGSIKLCEK